MASARADDSFKTSPESMGERFPPKENDFSRQRVNDKNNIVYTTKDFLRWFFKDYFLFTSLMSRIWWVVCKVYYLFDDNPNIFLEPLGV